MRPLFALVFFLHLAFPALCQIHLVTDEVWQDDTIYVEQNLIIDEGVTLTINSGTVVLFVGLNFIEVYGELNINGAAGDSVIMTARDNGWIEVNSMKKFYGWGGIFVSGNGIVNAKYTVFQMLGYSGHSRNGYLVEGVLRNESSYAMIFDHCRFDLKRDKQQVPDGCVIEGDNASVIIRNSIFKNNRGTGVLVKVDNDGSLIISNTTFSNNDILGVIISAASAFFNVDSCRFEDNNAGALLYGITFHGNSSVEKNTFKGNVGALHLQGVYASIYFRNNIYENNGGQIYFFLGNNVIAGNVFISNYYADPYDFFGNDYAGIVRIERTELSGPVIINNSFIDNRAMALRMSSVNSFNVDNNIFYNNYPSDTSLPFDSEHLNSEGRTFQYNLLQQSVPGAGNRNGNPRLSDAQEGFVLAPNSPGIDNGNPAYAGYLLSSDVLGSPRIKGQIDIGAVEFADSYVPLVDLNISNTVVARVDAGGEVARFTTSSQFSLDAITYSFSDDNGLNNDYFLIDGNKLILEKALTAETLLRIKVRADHVSGAWLEDYYYLTAAPIVVGTSDPAISLTTVFPLPADKFLRVDNAVPGMTYSIFSASGVKIKSDSLIEDAIDVSELTDGIYILQLIIGNKVDTIKFLKHAR